MRLRQWEQPTAVSWFLARLIFCPEDGRDTTAKASNTNTTAAATTAPTATTTTAAAATTTTTPACLHSLRLLARADTCAVDL
jgi:hypothetical protein